MPDIASRTRYHVYAGNDYDAFYTRDQFIEAMIDFAQHKRDGWDAHIHLDIEDEDQTGECELEDCLFGEDGWERVLAAIGAGPAPE